MLNLKFQFWDTTDKRWLIGSCNVGYNGGAYDINKNEYYPDVIVRQWTGRVDKNGKEIYAGDIVRKWYLTDNGLNYNGLPPFEVVWNQQHCGFGISYGARHTYEVLGNKFENPELLTT